MKTEGKNPHDKHRERIKARFMSEGLDNFAPHNALEYALTFSIPRGDVNDLAHDLISRFGSLSGVIDAPYEELLKVKGVGPKTATLLKFIVPFYKAYLTDRTSAGIMLDTPEKTGEYIMSLFTGLVKECIYLILIDNKKKVLNTILIGEGTYNATQENVRAICEAAVRSQAVACVIAHNHPFGLALPSNEDIATTDTIKKALDTFSIRLLDHIIVANDDYVSFKDSGFFAFDKT